MSRKARLIMNNACYHIMARGNQKQKIFLENEDFGKYLDLLRYYKKKYKFKLYCYCLMPNHVHLLLQIKMGRNLGKIMQGVNLTYAIWFNEKYNKVGHLWQGRYKSMLINKDRYMLECIQYIEINPIRAGICKSPVDYPWSSWQARINCNRDCLLDIPEL